MPHYGVKPYCARNVAISLTVPERGVYTASSPEFATGVPMCGCPSVRERRSGVNAALRFRVGFSPHSQINETVRH